eukprot:CFRG6767T1
MQYRSTCSRRSSKGHIVGHDSVSMPQLHEDDIPLVGAMNGSEQDLEAGLHPQLPPEWIDTVEEIQYSVSRLQSRMKELHTLHDKHLNRPNMTDGRDEEYEIEAMTHDITQMFQSTQQAIQGLNYRSKQCDSQAEIKMCRNVMTALAGDLQELSQTFRKAQSNYLQRIRGREEQKMKLFGSGAAMIMEDESGNDEDEIYDKQFTTKQIQQLEESNALVQERDREVANVMQSINELGEIFKELSVLIIDQGTMLDRIDYNLEQVSSTVADGLVQLEEGEKYQKKSRRKLCCILFLFIACLVMIILLGFKF